jgi:hypothetical protein
LPLFQRTFMRSPEGFLSYTALNAVVGLVSKTAAICATSSSGRGSTPRAVSPSVFG